MAQRCQETDVQGVLGTDWDGKTGLQRYIRGASMVVDRVAKCAADIKGTPLTDDELKEVETWLAAHMYCLMDQTYMSKSTGGASASFKGQTGMRLEMTNYGQNAMVLDYSGCLTAISKRQIAGAAWLGIDTTPDPPM